MPPPENERPESRRGQGYQRAVHTVSLANITERAFTLAANLDQASVRGREESPYAYAEHNRISKERINKTVDVGLKGIFGSVLILGDNPDDVPLELLAPKCEDITFAGLHTQRIEQAFDELSAHPHHARLGIVKADLTGVAGEITSIVDQNLHANPNRNDFLADLALDINGVHPAGKNPDLGRFDIVISSGTLSNLLRFPGRYIYNTVQNYYGSENPSNEAMWFIRDSLVSLTSEMEQEYVNFLVHSASGAVYFADIAEEIVTDPNGSRGKISVVDRDGINQLLYPHFDGTYVNRMAPREWTIETPGLDYVISSHSLTPKFGR